MMRLDTELEKLAHELIERYKVTDQSDVKDIVERWEGDPSFDFAANLTGYDRIALIGRIRELVE